MLNSLNRSKLALALTLLVSAGCVSSKTDIVDGAIESNTSEIVTDINASKKSTDAITTASIDETQQSLSAEKVPETIEEPVVVQASKVKEAAVQKELDETSDVEVSPAPTEEKRFQLANVYAQIVNAALTKDSFAEEALLRRSEHALAAHKQNLLPQVRPGASINADGDTIVRLNVEQVLFDNGQHYASQDVLLGQQSAANANYRIEQNERATKAISAYIEYHRLVALQKTTKEVVSIFKRYERQSRQRINNGIGDSSESDLFQVKKLQAETDHETLGSEIFAAEQEYKSITGSSMIMKTPVRLGIMKDFENSPVLALAKAERDEARGNLEVEKANRKPRLSLVGSVGSATDSFDDEDMDVRVEVSVNQPLNWGFNHALAAGQSEFEASNINYDKTLRDNRDKVKKLLLELKRAEASSKRLKKLANTANARVRGFNEQFLAGKSSINEAASIIDSYKQIKNNLTETEFRIFSIELEIASISGLV